MDKNYSQKDTRSRDEEISLEMAVEDAVKSVFARFTEKENIKEKVPSDTEQQVAERYAGFSKDQGPTSRRTLPELERAMQEFNKKVETERRKTTYQDKAEVETGSSASDVEKKQEDFTECKRESRRDVFQTSQTSTVSGAGHIDDVNKPTYYFLSKGEGCEVMTAYIHRLEEVVKQQDIKMARRKRKYDELDESHHKTKEKYHKMVENYNEMKELYRDMCGGIQALSQA